MKELSVWCAVCLKKFSALAVFFLFFAAAGESFAKITVDDEIHNALEGDWGQILFNMRYRFEHVEEESLKTANGDPARIRLGYLRKLRVVQGYLEFLVNSPVFYDEFNDSDNGKTHYSLINDPTEGALNQAWFSFLAIPDTEIKGGRQKLDWDNERFICPAAWRQMEQSFDSLTLLNTSVADFTLRAAYLWNGINTSNENVNMHSPMVNLNYEIQNIGSLSVYGYWLDYDDPDNSGPFEYAYSGQTYGFYFDGSSAVANELKLLYTAVAAVQSDYGSNPKMYTAKYYHLTGGLELAADGSLLSQISGKLGYEVYGTDNGVSFQTPLGANHRYNGWADLFGRTKPAGGLQDLYGAFSCTVAGVKVDLIYHDFGADADGSDYGAEIDTMFAKTFAEHYTLLASYSYYNADTFKDDVQKFWLQLTIDFSSPLISVPRWWL